MNAPALNQAPPRERPLLMSGPLVRAVLEGRKTQTRRLIRPDWWRCLDPEDAEDRAQALLQCPYGVPGTRLWVRETWALLRITGGSYNSWVGDYDDVDIDEWEGPLPKGGPPAGWCVVQDADGAWDSHRDDRGFRWRPSIHMPRWASRLLLEVTDVRVERLQAITEEDARAEGVEPNPVQPGTWVDYPAGTSAAGWSSPSESFRTLWDSINGERCPWDSNPFVWCVSFRVLEGGR